MIQENISLRKLNTFGIEARARYYVEIHSTSDFDELLYKEEYLKNKKLIIGGGSNILFTQNFNGIVLRNCLKGIALVKEDSESVWVKAAAGEVWHDFVMWTIAKGFGGLENLSLIPGCVGASPMQNIGAYGVEIKDCFDSLEARDINSGLLRVFTKSECRFGYRESVFKNIEKDKYFITSVTYRLFKNPTVNTTYGAIGQELEKMAVKVPGIRDVSNAVIRIRQSKLPDPNVLGNAGSFFKNPEVDKSVYATLIQKFPQIVAYPLPDERYKLAAGWLIEKAGWKGKKVGNAGVHDLQALVLVNLGSAKGSDIYYLSSEIIQSVESLFAIRLEREVNII
jgi:UDP-N-acetylmuramate dehydrogenase